MAACFDGKVRYGSLAHVGRRDAGITFEQQFVFLCSFLREFPIWHSGRLRRGRVAAIAFLIVDLSGFVE